MCSSRWTLRICIWSGFRPGAWHVATSLFEHISYFIKNQKIYNRTLPWLVLIGAVFSKIYRNHTCHILVATKQPMYPDLELYRHYLIHFITLPWLIYFQKCWLKTYNFFLFEIGESRLKCDIGNLAWYQAIWFLLDPRPGKA